jgi:hypothetical protein
LADWNIGQKSSGLLKVSERAVIVGLIYGMQTEDQLEDYLDELAFQKQRAQLPSKDLNKTSSSRQ